MRLRDYSTAPDDRRRREAMRGTVRDLHAPIRSYSTVVTRTAVLLDACVRPRGLGVIAVAPVDVVLDEARALILQPDVVFVSTARKAIVRDQIWGAPDLVVEVTSRKTALRDRTTKLSWYEQYGVRECWLLDDDSVMVVKLQSSGRIARRYRGDAPVQSAVLPGFSAAAAQFFR
jgi:Uma2 family endonuclease